MKQPYMLLLLFLLFAGTAAAQDIRITGKVTSATDGSAVPGVSIVIKGTTRGTTSDLNGGYELNAPADATLLFTFMGMQSQEIPVTNRKQINVEMVEAKVDLGEIVVVGYSTASKKLISSSFGLVNEEEIKNIPTRTLDGVLTGKVAGLTITQNSGTPGGQNFMKIRGGSSLTASNQPLIIIDGVPAITGSFGQIGYSGQEIDAISDLNPNDIEQVTILKDASATAVYGARGSNGVILITTKKGNLNKTSISFNQSYGWQVIPGERVLDLMNAQEWNEYKGTDVQGIDTDWMKEILQVAPTASTEFSVSSGNDKTRMYLSGNYFMQDGSVKGTSFDRYNGRLSVDHKLYKRLSVGGNISLSYSKNNRVEGDQTLFGPLPNALSIPAIYPVYNEDGSYNEDGPYANPVAIYKEAINVAYSNRMNGNVYMEYKCERGFTFTSKWGADLYNLREHGYDPITTRQGAKYNGLGIEGTSNVSNLMTSNVLQYIKTLDDKHNIEALLGYQYEEKASRYTYIEGIDFPNENLEYIASAGTIRAASASASNQGMVSYFGQFKYNYLYKYILTLTARADGSSKFGENNKFGYFPAASLAWRVKEEEFMKNIGAVSELKLRLTVGYTGNDGIPPFGYMGLYGGGYNYGGSSGIAPIQLPNPDLKWETTLQQGFGFDLGLFNDRLSLIFDIYYNKTHDLLWSRPLPPTSGFSSVSANIGSLENKGIEFVISSQNLKGDFTWNTSFNFAANRNKVTELYNDQPLDDIGRGGNRVQVGEPAGIFYGYQCLGVDPTTGDLVYADLNGDKVITADDRTKTGDPNPDFTAGLTNTFRYKNVDLSVFLQSVYGNDVFNGTFIYLESASGEDNQTKRMVNRWKQPGDITDIPRTGDTYKSSRFIEDGSFLRIKNVTLGYTLPQKWTRIIRLKSAKLFATSQNLYTFTSYLGMDPEVNYYGNDNVIMGTDFFTYPQARSFIIGINIGL